MTSFFSFFILFLNLRIIPCILSSLVLPPPEYCDILRCICEEKSRPRRQSVGEWCHACILKARAGSRVYKFCTLT